MKALELASQTRRDPLAPLYVVLGEEDYLRDRSLAALKEAVLGESGEADFNCDIFYGDEATAEQVLTCAMEMPIFAPRRLVALKQADKWPAREGEQCLPYLESPHESTILVFVAAKLDKRLKWTQTVLQHATIVDCSPLPDAQLPGWIRQEAAALGRTLQPDAVQYLKDLSDGSLYAVRRELEKLSVYVPPERPVQKKDVETLGGTEPGASVFDLVTAIGARAVGRTLTIVARNFEAGETPLRILGALVWQYRRLWKAKEAVRQSGRPGEAARALRMDPGQAMSFLAEFDEGHLADAFRLFLEADSKLKGGSANSGKRVLEDLLLRLCSRPRSIRERRSSPSGETRKPPARAMSNIRTIRTGKR